MLDLEIQDLQKQIDALNGKPDADGSLANIKSRLEALENAEALGGIGGPARSGYTFSGWAISEGGPVVYKAEELAFVPTGTVLYAVWTAN